MIELTGEQRRTLTQGIEIPISDPETSQEYILVRADIYRHLKNFTCNVTDLTPEDQMGLLAQSGKGAGWDEPEMDAYDSYEENHKKLPIAVLISVNDPDEIERIAMSQSKKLQKILRTSQTQIEKGKGIPQDRFWQEVEQMRQRQS